MREILSAITLSKVLIYLDVIPTGLLIIKAHWMRLRARPMSEILLALRIQDSADVLSAHSSMSGNGSSTEGLI